MDIASHITFTGSPGDPIIDTNGQTVTKEITGSNTVDLDGSGNGVFTLVTGGGLDPTKYARISEPVVETTDLTDKDFTITISDFLMSGATFVTEYFFIGDAASFIGFALTYVMGQGFYLQITKGLGSPPDYYIIYFTPEGWTPWGEGLHTVVISRISGVYSASFGSLGTLTPSVDTLTGAEIPSYEGTGVWTTGIGLDSAASHSITMGDFKLERSDVFNTVTYNTNGGAGTIVDPNSPYEPGATVTVLSSSGMSYLNHNFVNWNTSADGSGTSYNPSDTFTITEATTLYAQWTRPYYTGNIVSKNGGSFTCIQDHNTSADNEPGVGINWRNYWAGYPALHTDLTDVQGGDSTSSEYYHLTESQHTKLADGTFYLLKGEWVPSPLMLLHFDGNNQSFVDSSTAARTIKVDGTGDVSQTDAEYVWNKSVLFEGDVSLTIATTDFNFGTRLWAIDLWNNSTSDGAQDPTLFSNDDEVNYFNISYKNEYFYIGMNLNISGVKLITTDSIYPVGSWRHLAVARTSPTNVTFFIDGDPVGSVTIDSEDTFDLSSGGAAQIAGGSWSGHASWYRGYIDEIRIYDVAMSNGESYVVPTEPSAVVYYYENEIVSHKSKLYKCILDHESLGPTEPGVGDDWETYWDVVYTYDEIDHNEISGLQGGDSTSSEYYHITEEEHTYVQNVSGANGVDLGSATPTTITFEEMSSTEKTWFLDHSSDQTITFAAPESGDKFKRFTIMKTGTGAGAVIIDCPASVYIYAEGQATTAGGTLTLAAGKRGCVTLVVTSTTSLQVVSADGDLTFA